MKASHIIAVASAVGLAAAQDNSTVCVSGAHVIVARASLEPPGYGTLNAVKDMVLERIPDSNAVAVPYPATITGAVLYTMSEPEGVGNLTQLIKEYGDACPGHKMVLMGYSQGAHVIGDTLIGSDYLAIPAFPNTTGIDQSYIDNIAAVVMMGDPANVAGQPFLHGNSTNNGTFPRNNTAGWASAGLVDKMISYCDANDYFCDQGKSIIVHVGYVAEYGSQAADFVVEKFMANNSSSPSSTASGTASSTGSGSGSPSSTGSDSPAASASSSSSTSSAASLLSSPSTYALIGVVQCISAYVLLVWL